MSSKLLSKAVILEINRKKSATETGKATKRSEGQAEKIASLGAS